MTAYSGCDGTIVLPSGNLVEMSGFTLDESAETINTSVMDGTCANDVEVSTTSWGGSLELFYDPDELAQGELSIGAAVDAEFYPLGEVEALERMTGQMLITAKSMPVEANGLIALSITFEGKGLLTREATPPPALINL